MADAGNFRSQFYSRVALSAVDGKKSIEALLKEKQVDVKKLELACLRYNVHTQYRCLLWKLILGVLPPYQETHDSVMAHRSEHYEMLKRVVSLMRFSDDSMPLHEQFGFMYLIEDKALVSDKASLAKLDDLRNFQQIARAISEMFEPVDAYWISRNLYRRQKKNLKDYIHVLVDHTHAYLRKEDPDSRLYDHLDCIGALKELPLSKWFSTCYCSILHEESLGRLLDKVIAGPVVLLSFVAVALLMQFRRSLMKYNHAGDVNRFLSSIPEDAEDAIVANGIQLWQKYSVHQIPLSARSSPVVM